MCRNIKQLANFDPPATEEEIRAASLQFVRKVSGVNKPAKQNEIVFAHAVDEVARCMKSLLDGMVIHGTPRNREEVARQAQEKARKRFGTPNSSV